MALSPLFLSNNAFSWVTKRKARTRGYWVVVGWDKHGIYHGVSWLYLAPFLTNRNIIPVVIFPSHNGTTLCTTAIHDYEIPNLRTRMDWPIRTWHSRCRTRSYHHEERSIPCESLRVYCNDFVSRTPTTLGGITYITRTLIIVNDFWRSSEAWLETTTQ